MRARARTREKSTAIGFRDSRRELPCRPSETTFSRGKDGTPILTVRMREGVQCQRGTEPEARISADCLAVRPAGPAGTATEIARWAASIGTIADPSFVRPRVARATFRPACRPPFGLRITIDFWPVGGLSIALRLALPAVGPVCTMALGPLRVTLLSVVAALALLPVVAAVGLRCRMVAALRSRFHWRLQALECLCARHEVGRKRPDRKPLARCSLDITQVPALVRRAEGNSNSFRSGTRCATNAVDILLGHVR